MLGAICKQNSWTSFNRSSIFLQAGLSRTHSIRTVSKDAQSPPSGDVWIPVYKFPYIKFISALNRIKLYQFGITGLGIPMSLAIESAGRIPEGCSMVFSALGVSGCFTLAIVGLVAKNLIGILYTNQTNDKVKVSYVDFWGKRRNLEFNTTDIVNPIEMPRAKFNIYTPVKVVDTNLTYKLVHRFGGIKDQERYAQLFGE